MILFNCIVNCYVFISMILNVKLDCRMRLYRDFYSAVPNLQKHPLNAMPNQDPDFQKLLSSKGCKYCNLYIFNSNLSCNLCKPLKLDLLYLLFFTQ
jgi:hypothetical protein